MLVKNLLLRNLLVNWHTALGAWRSIDRLRAKMLLLMLVLVLVLLLLLLLLLIRVIHIHDRLPWRILSIHGRWCSNITARRSAAHWKLSSLHWKSRLRSHALREHRLLHGDLNLAHMRIL